jgi:hypothetical protein
MFVISNKVYVKINFFNDFMVHKRSLHLTTKMKASSKRVVTFFWNYIHAFEGVKFSRFLFLFIIGFYRWMHTRKCFGVEWTMVKMEHYCQSASSDSFVAKKMEAMTLWKSCLSKMFWEWCCCDGVLDVDYE